MREDFCTRFILTGRKRRLKLKYGEANYGYYRSNSEIMLIMVVILVLIVQVFQEVGSRIAHKSDRRVRDQT